MQRLADYISNTNVVCSMVGDFLRCFRTMRTRGNSAQKGAGYWGGFSPKGMWVVPLPLALQETLSVSPQAFLSKDSAVRKRYCCVLLCKMTFLLSTVSCSDRHSPSVLFCLWCVACS